MAGYPSEVARWLSPVKAGKSRSVTAQVILLLPLPESHQPSSPLGILNDKGQDLALK